MIPVILLTLQYNPRIILSIKNAQVSEKILLLVSIVAKKGESIFYNYINILWFDVFALHKLILFCNNYDIKL